MTNELIYETEHGEQDELFRFVYEFEPYDPGCISGPSDNWYPPEGGTATINEIRTAKGEKVPDSMWLTLGFDKAEIKRLEEEIYTWHGENERDRYEAAEEAKGDAMREDRD